MLRPCALSSTTPPTTANKYPFESLLLREILFLEQRLLASTSGVKHLFEIIEKNLTNESPGGNPPKYVMSLLKFCRFFREKTLLLTNTIFRDNYRTAQNEEIKIWLQVVTELPNCGVQDRLRGWPQGLPDDIEAEFPVVPRAQGQTQPELRAMETVD
jgi:hypothetical protein